MKFTPTTYPTDKKQLYRLLKTQLQGLIDGIPYTLSNLANASALLYQALPNINWAGFYLIEDGRLILGPFQGKPACVKIEIGKGVCGTAVSLDEIMLVKNVHEFPGHIACDSASNSEIVIPLHANGKIIGVLDIDSPILSRFDEEDRAGLLTFTQILEQSIR
ncbi:GAF domain-containing protein [Roseburia hominis]